METTHKINQYIVTLTGKEEANLLFIGTASHDAEDYISAIHSEFESLRCVVKELSLTSEKYTDDEISIHPYAFCPHYNERAERFDEMIKEKPFPGIALEENVAFVEKNGSIGFISSDDSSKACLITLVDGKLEKRSRRSWLYRSCPIWRPLMQ